MRNPTSWAKRLGATLALLSLCNCSLVIDVDRFKEAPKTTGSVGTDGYLSLKFTVLNMVPHVEQYFEFRIVDAAHNVMPFRGIVNPLGTLNATFNAPMAIPQANGPYWLDYWADNGDSKYTWDPAAGVAKRDHSWRNDTLTDVSPDAPDEAPDGTVSYQFTHNTIFTDIDTPQPSMANNLDAKIHLTGLDNYQARMIQVRVTDPVTHHCVGLYRVTKLTTTELDANIPGMFDTATYQIDIYVDNNLNEAYDNPATGSGDLGWSVSREADEIGGLSFTLDLSDTSNANFNVGEP